jgi:hypothetical protein
MEINTLLGKDLPDKYIELMNRQRIHEYQINTKNFRQNEQESKFFFICEGTQIKAFGMLKPLTLTYQQQSFHILGIGNIIAIEKEGGYGTRLMAEIQCYLKTENRIGLGFCKRTIASFYAKCDYDIVVALSERFRYLYAKESTEREKLNDPRDILCFDADSSLIKTLQSSNDLIYINVPFW